MSDAELERIEERLAAIPESSTLAADAAAEFRTARLRIAARQRQWREGMPALAPLFDGDAHRAKALAGNLATELEMLLVAWAGSAAGTRGSTDADTSAWLSGTAAEWRRQASRYGRLQDWEAEALDVFDGVLEELTERGLRRAEARLDAASAAPAGGARRMAPLRWVGVLLGRWLQPGAGPARGPGER